MNVWVRLAMVSLVLGLVGCGPPAGVQLPDEPTPPPGQGPKAATVPDAARQRLVD